MKKILLAWERGSAYGHLMRDLPIADRLRREGCEVIFVLRDVRVAAELLVSRGHPFIASPIADLSLYSNRAPETYADRLHRQGYSDELALLGMVEAWLRTIELVKPDILYANYAPTAMLAADILGLPQYLVGTGWEVPPPVSPSPSLELDRPTSDQELEAHEASICDVINRVRDRYRASPLASIADLFRDKPTALTTFSELDHYGRYFERSGHSRPEEQYVGHIASLAAFDPADWRSSGGRRRIFAYLRPSETASTVLAALGALPPSFAEVICVMPGATGVHRQLAGAHVQLHDSGIRLGSILPRADLMINYGGAGTVCAALLAGVPLLLVPDTLERGVTAERVAALGAGIVAGSPSATISLSDAIAELLADARYTAAARRFADKYRDMDPDYSISRIVAGILAIS